MFNGGGEIPAPQKPTQPAQQNHRPGQGAYVKIIEQPAPKALRFRYECEGRSAGSIPGASSIPENKTYPAIQVVGYRGRAVVVVSCVTKDEPYKAHPHNLVGREGCKRGVCTLEIPPDTMTVHFSNLGIQCVKKKDIEQALKAREEIRVDPFRQGFDHRNQPTSIDLNAVRLCFQVFLEGSSRRFTQPLHPVVSEPIYDKKAMSDLSIVRLSDCNSYVDGGRKDIILLCEKVAKEDIQIRFFEENGDWEAFADFQPSQVHKQHAIWFRPPRYKTLDVTEPVKVFIQLKRPSDGASSEPLPFELLPLDSEPGALKRKRQKIENPDQILRHLQEQSRSGNFSTNFPLNTIKSEPRDTTPSPYQGGLSPYSAYNIGTSPQYRPTLEPTPSPDPFQEQHPSPQYNIGQSPQHELWHVAGNVVSITSWQDLPGPSSSSVVSSTQQQQWNILLGDPQTQQMQLTQQQQTQGQSVLMDLDTGGLNSEEIDIRAILYTDNNASSLPEISDLSLDSDNNYPPPPPA